MPPSYSFARRTDASPYVGSVNESLNEESRSSNSPHSQNQDPFDLKGCIVSTECEEEAFEVQELMAKESYMFKV